MCNKIGTKGTESLTLALSQLINLNSLHLDLEKSELGDKGATFLSSRLSMLKNLHSLKLNLKLNKIG